MPARSVPPVDPEAADEDAVIELTDDPFSLTGVELGDPPQDETPRSRTRAIVLSSLLAVTVAGAAVLGYSGWKIAGQKDATLTTPPEIAGLRMDTTEDGKATAEYLRTALSAEVDLDQATGAVYTDATNRSVLFFGGTALIWTPGADLKTAFDLISDDQGAVTGLHDVSPGKFGGVMRCGTTVTDDGNMSVCGWSDHGSLALAMFPQRSEADAANLLRQIRDVSQQRQ